MRRCVVLRRHTLVSIDVWCAVVRLCVRCIRWAGNEPKAMEEWLSAAIGPRVVSITGSARAKLEALAKSKNLSLVDAFRESVLAMEHPALNLRVYAVRAVM